MIINKSLIMDNAFLNATELLLAGSPDMGTDTPILDNSGGTNQEENNMIMSDSPDLGGQSGGPSAQ
jgi:hypothetical protein